MAFQYTPKPLESACVKTARTGRITKSPRNARAVRVSAVPQDNEDLFSIGPHQTCGYTIEMR